MTKETDNPSLKNLEKGRWKKGKSGNPKGRPKGSKGITSILRSLLEAKIITGKNIFTDKKSKLTGSEIIAYKIFQQAAKGDFRFCKEIIDRIDGTIDEQDKTIVINNNIDTDPEKIMRDRGIPIPTVDVDDIED